MNVELKFGNYLDIIEKMPSNSISAIITDPPYTLTPYWLKEAKRVCKGNIVAFCNPENQWPNPDEHLFWVKPLSTKNFQNKCGRFVEIICVYRRGNTFNQLHWSQMAGIFYDLLENSELNHPWEKPIGLLERLVKIYTNPGDTVLDLFMGSGTTGLACVKNERNFIGIEVNESAFEIAKQRLEVK
jgi:site-specific DNA-methyltransferase (adenine-specific)